MPSPATSLSSTTSPATAQTQGSNKSLASAVLPHAKTLARTEMTAYWAPSKPNYNSYHLPTAVHVPSFTKKLGRLRHLKKNPNLNPDAFMRAFELCKTVDIGYTALRMVGEKEATGSPCSSSSDAEYIFRQALAQQDERMQFLATALLLGDVTKKELTAVEAVTKTSAILAGRTDPNSKWILKLSRYLPARNS